MSISLEDPHVSDGGGLECRTPLCDISRSSQMTLELALWSPGLLAAGLQLSRGTKYRRFPHWLDRWLSSRKQLGLLSFLCAGLHAVYSMCLSIRRAAQYSLLNAAYTQVCVCVWPWVCPVGLFRVTTLTLSNILCASHCIIHTPHARSSHLVPHRGPGGDCFVPHKSCGP